MPFLVKPMKNIRNDDEDKLDDFDDDSWVLICEQRVLMSKACLREALLRCQRCSWPSLQMMRMMKQMIRSYSRPVNVVDAAAGDRDSLCISLSWNDLF